MNYTASSTTNSGAISKTLKTRATVLRRSVAARRAMAEFLANNAAPKDNPYFWVMRFPEPQPTNYNGRSFPAGAQMVIAIYNGTGGVYTKADAELYNMTIKKEIEP